METELNNFSDISLYMEASFESLAAARLNFDNSFFSAAANRIYYAAFYAVTALLKTNNLSFSKHSAVLSAYGCIL